MTKFCLSFLLLIAVFTVSSQEKLKGQPDLPGDILIDFGINYWNQKRDTIKNWPSRSLGIYYNKRYKISNKLSFYAAVGFGFENYAFKDNYFLNRGDNGEVILDTINNVTLDKNKLAVMYLDMPLEIRIHPKGTAEGEGFFLSAGVVPGLKLNAHTKLKSEENEGTQRQKYSSNFGLNDYRVGLQFRVGWKGVNFFYKTYLTKVFRSPQNLVDPDLILTGYRFNPSTTTFGINFSGF